MTQAITAIAFGLTIVSVVGFLYFISNNDDGPYPPA